MFRLSQRWNSLARRKRHHRFQWRQKPIIYTAMSRSKSAPLCRGVTVTHVIAADVICDRHALFGHGVRLEIIWLHLASRLKPSAQVLFTTPVDLNACSIRVNSISNYIKWMNRYTNERIDQYVNQSMKKIFNWRDGVTNTRNLWPSSEDPLRNPSKSNTALVCQPSLIGLHLSV